MRINKFLSSRPTRQISRATIITNAIAQFMANESRARDEPSEIILFEKHNEWPRGRFVALTRESAAHLRCVVHCLPQRCCSIDEASFRAFKSTVYERNKRLLVSQATISFSISS